MAKENEGRFSFSDKLSKSLREAFQKIFSEAVQYSRSLRASQAILGFAVEIRCGGKSEASLINARQRDIAEALPAMAVDSLIEALDRRLNRANVLDGCPNNYFTSCEMAVGTSICKSYAVANGRILLDLPLECKLAVGFGSIDLSIPVSHIEAALERVLGGFGPVLCCLLEEEIEKN